jgi:hypothetical protein
LLLPLPQPRSSRLLSLRCPICLAMISSRSTRTMAYIGSTRPVRI